MISKERAELIALCGSDCGVCELYICKDLSWLYDKLVEKGMPKDKIPCKGCSAIQGDCPVLEVKCETYACVSGKKLEFCNQCGEFSYNHLLPAAHRVDTLPYNLKAFNLCMIEKQGMETFVVQSKTTSYLILQVFSLVQMDCFHYLRVCRPAGTFV